MPPLHPSQEGSQTPRRRRPTHLLPGEDIRGGDEPLPTVHPLETESYAVLRTRLDTADPPPLTRAVVEPVAHATAGPAGAGGPAVDEDDAPLTGAPPRRTPHHQPAGRGHAPAHGPA